MPGNPWARLAASIWADWHAHELPVEPERLRQGDYFTDE